MVAPVREYNRQFGAQSADQGRRATPEDFGSAHGLQDLAQGMTSAASIMQRHEENREISDAQLKMAESDAVWDEKRQQLQKEAQPGVSTATKIKDDMTGYFTQMAGNYKTDAARNYVRLHGTRLTTQNFNQSSAFDVDLVVKDRFNKIDGIFDGAQKLVYSDPSQYEAKKSAILFDAKNRIGVFDMPGDARVQVALDKEVQKRVEGLALMAAQGDLQNPAVRGMIVGSVKAPVNTEGVIQTLLKREGGYVVNDAGRGETNFGINKTAHPNEDIKGMTAEKAAQIYKRDYWDAYGVGNLDPSVQAVVFDGVVNHRSGFKEQLVSAAKNGASAQQLGEMRMAEYRRLAEADPSKAKYMTSWTKRVNDTIREVAETSSQVDTPPELKQKPAWWDDLSAEKQVAVTRDAQTLEHQNRNIADRANAKLINDEQNHFAATGKLSAQAPKMNNVTDPEQRQELQTLYDASSKLAGIMDKPAAEQNEFLERNKPEASGIPGDYTYKLKVYGQMARFINENQKLRQEDQVTAAYRMGFGGKQAEIKPLAEYGDGEKLGVEISNRVAHTDAIQKTWGMKDNKIFMENEAQNVRNTFRSLKVEDQPAYLSGLAKNISKEHFDALTKQVWKNDHEIRGAAILSNLGTTKSQNGSSAERTSELILLGRKVLDSNVVKEGGEKMPGFKGVLPSDESIREYVGAHLAGQYLPETMINALTNVVKAHYIGNLQTKGVQKTYELTESANQTYLKDSIKTVIGVPSTVGPTKVTRPWGMSDAEFQDDVKAQANEMGFMGRHYGLVAIEGRDKQYALVINGKTEGTIDLNRPNYKQLQSGGDTIEPRASGVYGDAFKMDSVKEALGISNFKLPNGRADELGWWEQ